MRHRLPSVGQPVNENTDDQPWRVLLIGGNSGAGKTVLTGALAQHLGISRLLVDDLRLAMQAFTSAEQHPDVHYFVTTPAVWCRPAEDLRDGLIRVGSALCPPLATIIAHHVVVADAGRLIIEGDGIVPQLAAQRDFSAQKVFSGLKLRAQVRSIFVIEDDEATILANMHARGRGFDEQPLSVQHLQARVSHLYGRWLRQEAMQYGLTVLSARPWDTLLSRALVTIADRA